LIEDNRDTSNYDNLLDLADDDIDASAIATIKASHAILMPFLDKVYNCSLSSLAEFITSITKLDPSNAALDKCRAAINDVPVIQKLFHQIQTDSGARAHQQLSKIMQGGVYTIISPTVPIGSPVDENDLVKLQLTQRSAGSYTLRDLEDLRNRLVFLFKYLC
jgi:hypothetical protein